ncbi:hypothetical protein P8452_40625 [Trifolium repens]|nr:hypothetical protein P8452_40625 [Trifolium repens]
MGHRKQDPLIYFYSSFTELSPPLSIFASSNPNPNLATAVFLDLTLSRSRPLPFFVSRSRSVLLFRLHSFDQVLIREEEVVYNLYFLNKGSLSFPGVEDPRMIALSNQW